VNLSKVSSSQATRLLTGAFGKLHAVEIGKLDQTNDNQNLINRNISDM
jgi:hypothetical protein